MKKQMMSVLLILFSSFLIFSIGEINKAQAQQSNNGKPVTEATQADQNESVLEDVWELTEMDGEAVDDLFPDKHPTIEFKMKENQVVGFAGCNQYRGQFILEKEYIKVVGVIATKMACPVLDEEDEFLAILQEVEEYIIAGKELSLWSGGQQVLKFRKAD